MIETPIATLDDHALLLRVADGDIRAFEALYDRYSAQAHGLAMRVTGRRRAAEEVTQDAFLSLWRTARSYDSKRGAVRTWLLSIARNRSIDWLRHEARHERNIEIDDVPSERLEIAEPMEEAVVEREQSDRTHRLLAKLPAEQREVINLAYFKGLSQTEIAAKIKIPLGTVKGRQRLALTKLHRALISAPEVIDQISDQVPQRRRQSQAVLNG
jgi:RNA polymerase sigma-70 factor (ECF subfamily)